MMKLVLIVAIAWVAFSCISFSSLLVLYNRRIRQRAGRSRIAER